MTLEGDLGDVSLANLIQLMGTHRRSGGIVLKRPGETGLVYFVDGEIVDAAAGTLQGEDAVYRVLSWDEATFEVRETLRPAGRSIWMDWKQLLFDGARRLDEGKHQDETEDDLVALMSALEQIQVKLRDKKLRRRPVQTLVFYGELVNRVVEFWEGLGHDARPQSLEAQSLEAQSLEPRSLEAAVIELARETPAARLLEPRHGRLSPEHLEEVARTLPKGPVELSIPAVCAVLLDLVERFLELIVERFRSAELRQQWSETCAFFLQELRANLELVEL